MSGFTIDSCLSKSDRSKIRLRERAQERKPISQKSAKKQLKHEALRDRITGYELDHGKPIMTLRDKDKETMARIIAAMDFN